MEVRATAERSETTPSARASLWRDRDFILFFGGQGVSALGSVISITALPLLVLQLTGSGVDMATVAALQSLPPLLFGLPAGGIADRWDRRMVMVISDTLRALLLAAIPLALLLHLPALPVIYATAAPLGLLGVLFQTAYAAALPQLVGREQLARANSYTQAAASGAWAIGPAVAGVLAAWIGPGPTLALDVVSFALSVATLGLIRRALRPERAARARGFWHDIGAGLRLVVGNGTLRVLMALWGVYNFAVTPTIQVLTFYVTIDRGLDAENMGLLISSFGVGLFAGSLLAGRVMAERGGARLLGAMGLVGMGFALFGLAGRLPLMVPISAAIGVGDGLMWVGYVTLRTRLVPGEFLGRVSSVSQTLALGLSPLGLLAAGFALDHIRGGGTLIAMGALLMLASLLFAASGELRAEQGVN